MNKKLLAVALAVAVSVLAYPVFAADLGITGTFDPITSCSAELWNSTFAWGNLAYNANVTKVSQLNNTGSVIIDSTIHNDSYTGDLTLVAQAENNAQDEFACIFNSVDTTWADIGSVASPVTLDSDIAIGGTSSFTVNLLGNGVGWSADHSSQSFNLTITYTENT